MFSWLWRVQNNRIQAAESVETSSISHLPSSSDHINRTRCTLKLYQLNYLYRPYHRSFSSPSSPISIPCRAISSAASTPTSATSDHRSPTASFSMPKTLSTPVTTASRHAASVFACARTPVLPPTDSQSSALYSVATFSVSFAAAPTHRQSPRRL